MTCVCMSWCRHTTCPTKKYCMHFHFISPYLMPTDFVNVALPVPFSQCDYVEKKIGAVLKKYDQWASVHIQKGWSNFGT